MALISIIVPAYNVEQYIRKCIESILNQSFIDFEVILVDDGSTDNTSIICDEFKVLDDRIHVFHKSNGGLSDARNYGLKVAIGEFITFVDSDDYVAPNYLDVLIQPLLMNREVSISMVSTQELSEGHNPVKYSTFPVKIVPQSEAIRKMLLRDGFSHCGVGKMYKKELWENFCFPKGRLYEDYLTTYHVFSEAKKIAICECGLYYYIQRSGSIMHYECSDRTLTILDVADEVTRFLYEKWPDLKDEALDLEVASYLKCYQQILNLGFNEFPEQQERILNMIHHNTWQVLKSKRINNKQKVKLILTYMGRSVFSKVYNVADGSVQVND